MNRSLCRAVACLQIGLVLLTGCHPTQPFFIAERSDLRHYLETATQIEYPDLQVESLPEVTETLEPLSIDREDYKFHDWTLEEVVAIALQNSKIVRALPGSNQQTGDIATAILSSPSSQLNTPYDPAIAASTANTQAMVTDQNGNRILPRGAIRANQVGSVEDALSEFDAQFSSFVAYNTTDRPRNTGTGANANIFTPPQFTAHDTTGQVAISKRTAVGSVLTARAQTIYSENNIIAPSLARAFPSDYTQTIEMQIQQPLMRNRGTLVNRVPIVLARINEDLSLGQYEERVRNLVKEVENAYWDLYCAYWGVETARLGRDSALKVWHIANASLDAGGTATLDQKLQAEGQFYQFNFLMHAALNGSTLGGSDPQGVRGREQILRFLMGLAPTDGYLIRPKDKPTVAQVQFDWAAIQGESLTRNIDLRQQKWLVKQRDLELISAKNQLLPDVNISALYRWLGVGDVWSRPDGNGPDFPIGPSSAMTGLLGGDYQELALRLEIIPNANGSRRAHAQVRSAQLSLVRENEILKEKELALMSSLTAAFRQVDAGIEQMTLKLNEWNAAEGEIKFFEDRIKSGMPSNQGFVNEVDRLLRGQQKRARAQQEYYRLVCDYNKSIVQVHLLKGSLLEYNNILLEEGPWPQKAYWDATERARERNAARYFDYGASRPSVVSQGPLAQSFGTANALATPGAGLRLNDSSAEPTPANRPEGNAPDAPDSTAPKSLFPKQPDEAPVTPQPDPDIRANRRSQAVGSGISTMVERPSPSQASQKFDWNGSLATTESSIATRNSVPAVVSEDISQESRVQPATLQQKWVQPNTGNKSSRSNDAIPSNPYRAPQR